MQRSYKGADGVRGLACLLVLLAHAPGFFVPSLAPYFSGTGKFGVWLFFVLSAFLLTNKFERTGFGFSAISAYGVGRVLRIIPIFSLVVVLCYFVGAAGINNYGDVGAALAFQKGYAHLWTIPVEFKFYFLLPVFAYCLISVKRIFGHGGALLVAVFMIAATQFIWPFWLTPENSIDTHWYLPSFIIGCYAAVSMDVFRTIVKGAVADAMAALALCAVILLTPFFRNLLFQMPIDGWLQNKFIMLSLIWCVFLVAVAEGSGFFGGVMKSLVLRKLGAWSFSIYLIHWVVYGFLASNNLNGFVWLVVGVLSSITAGALMYMLIESNIENIRHSIQVRMARQNMLEK